MPQVQVLSPRPSVESCRLKSAAFYFYVTIVFIKNILIKTKFKCIMFRCLWILCIFEISEEWYIAFFRYNIFIPVSSFCDNSILYFAHKQQKASKYIFMFCKLCFLCMGRTCFCVCYAVFDYFKLFVRLVYRKKKKKQ